MAVYQYQTVGISIKILDPESFDALSEAVVSVKQGYNIAHFKMSDGSLEVDVENQTVRCNLSQEDTAKFRYNHPIEIMVNFYNEYGDRLVSKNIIAEEDVEENLYKVVME